MGVLAQFGAGIETQLVKDLLQVSAAIRKASGQALQLRQSGWRLASTSSPFSIGGGDVVTVNAGITVMAFYNPTYQLWEIAGGFGVGVGTGAGLKIKGVDPSSPVSVGGTDFKAAKILASLSLSKFIPDGSLPLYLGPAGSDGMKEKLFSGFATFIDIGAAAGLYGGGLGAGGSFFAFSDVPLILSAVAGGAFAALALEEIKIFGVVYGGDSPILPSASAGVDVTTYPMQVISRPGGASSMSARP